MERRPEHEVMDEPAVAEAYAAADFTDVNQKFVDRLLQIVGPRSSVQAIDLGTGPGDIPILLAQQRPTWSITAVDASEAMLGIAEARRQSAGVRNLGFVLGNATASRFPAGQFDLVFSNSLLHHVADPMLLWREIQRLCRPTGCIIVRDLTRPASREVLEQLVQTYAGSEPPLLQSEFRNSLAAAYSADEVREQLRRVGLPLDVSQVSDRHLDAVGSPADE